MDKKEMEIRHSHTDETLAAMEVMASCADSGDFDRKYIQKISGSFGQARKLMKLKTQKQKPIGGHADKILFDGDLLWKKVPLGKTGIAELAFLKLALTIPEISMYVPTLMGTCLESDGMWVGMKNALYGFGRPAVLDLKIGTRTHTPDAPPEKARQSQKRASQTTSLQLGFRVVGGKLLGPDGTFLSVGYKQNNNINSEEGVIDLFSRFFCTEALLSAAIKGVHEIACWMESQRSFAFYSSSLLFAYDTQNMVAPTIRLIDFANFKFIQHKDEDLTGFQFGLMTLHRILGHVVPQLRYD